MDKGETSHSNLSVTADTGKRNPKGNEKEMQNMICYDPSLVGSNMKKKEKEKKKKPDLKRGDVILSREKISEKGKETHKNHILHLSSEIFVLHAHADAVAEKSNAKIPSENQQVHITAPGGPCPCPSLRGESKLSNF